LRLYSLCNILSDERMGLRLLLVLASAVILRFESCRTHDHILLSKIRDSPNLEAQVTVFISPRNRVARLYPQALSSFFVASYDSQGYGGGIWPHLHMGLPFITVTYVTTANSSSTILCLFVAAETCLATRCQAANALLLLSA
jgi:hypothetical protein